MARKRRNCIPINGILLLDKPKGLTSNKALQAVKNLYRACKAGHTGSLDPLATGLLPLCFGEGTKMSQFLLDANKHYQVQIKLGLETTTFDAEGEIVATKPVKISERELAKALRGFLGDIEQIPPMYSAVKIDGQPLYKLARKGIEVERAPRPVTIHDISEPKWLAEDEIELEIRCTKGTYVRTLAHDLGQRLGCGAHVQELRRLGVGDLNLQDAITMTELEQTEDKQSLLMPLNEGLSHYPGITLTSLATHYLLQGQPVTVRHDCQPGWVRLNDQDERFLGMGLVLDDGRVAPKRMVYLDQKTCQKT